MTSHRSSGMLMLLLGRLPATGDSAVWEGWHFEVVDLDGKRIDKVRPKALPEPAPDGALAAADDGR